MSKNLLVNKNLNNLLTLGGVWFQVGQHPDHNESRCFIVERPDGTVEDFSYKKCFFGALEMLDPRRAKLIQSKYTKNGSTQKA